VGRIWIIVVRDPLTHHSTARIVTRPALPDLYPVNHREPWLLPPRQAQPRFVSLFDNSN
jgi:hypothetical protein